MGWKWEKADEAGVVWGDKAEHAHGNRGQHVVLATFDSAEEAERARELLEEHLGESSS